MIHKPLRKPPRHEISITSQKQEHAFWEQYDLSVKWKNLSTKNILNLGVFLNGSESDLFCWKSIQLFHSAIVSFPLPFGFEISAYSTSNKQWSPVALTPQNGQSFTLLFVDNKPHLISNLDRVPDDKIKIKTNVNHQEVIKLKISKAGLPIGPLIELSTSQEIYLDLTENYFYGLLSSESLQGSSINKKQLVTPLSKMQANKGYIIEKPDASDIAIKTVDFNSIYAT